MVIFVNLVALNKIFYSLINWGENVNNGYISGKLMKKCGIIIQIVDFMSEIIQ